MKFSEMNKKQLATARDSLVKHLCENTTLRPSRVICLTDGGCTIEGGTFPATYDHTKRELTIWGRGSRYAGGSRTITELKQIEDAVINWFDTYTKEEK